MVEEFKEGVYTGLKMKEVVNRWRKVEGRREKKIPRIWEIKREKREKEREVGMRDKR